MKRILVLMLALLLCLALALPALGEATDEETLKQDQSRAYWGLALTAQVLGNAVDRQDPLNSDGLASYYRGFAAMDFLRPDKVIIVDLTEEQAKAACAVLGADSNAGIGPALAAYLNRDYPRYAQAAGNVQARFDNREIKSGLVLLPCREHIAVISMWDGQAQASLIISMPESSAALNAEEIQRYAGQMGLQGLTIRVYEGNAMDELLSLGNWSFGSNSGICLRGAVTASQARLQSLYPLLLSSALGTEALNTTLGVYLYNHQQDVDQALLRQIASGWLAVPQDEGTSAAQAYLSANNTRFTVQVPAPEIPALADALTEGPLSPDGTYLFICTQAVPGKEPVTWYDLLLESALPARCIPENIQEADYIIFVSVDYDEALLRFLGHSTGVTNKDSVLHYPLTHVTIHDARTGAMLRDCGYDVRTLQGFTMVNKGDTYWDPSAAHIWEKVSGVFVK